MGTTNYNFGEKTEEYSAKQGKKIPVWKSDKYEESKIKACEIIESGKYGLTAADFWILMNETKSGKMGYTGLIISHNGCLKINDKLEKPFNPTAVTEDKCGYGGALVYTYCDKDQGLYEVGEVTPRNCKNDYPYAMAFKRMFDRVVLKLSKLAYSGIYSEAESDTFKDPIDDTRNSAESTPEKAQTPAVPQEENVGIMCQRCGRHIYPTKKKNGEIWAVSDIAKYSLKRFQKEMCPDCMKLARAEENANVAG